MLQAYVWPGRRLRYDGAPVELPERAPGASCGSPASASRSGAATRSGRRDDGASRYCGGGVSGLTFAARHARGSAEVVVFEREARVGGKSCTVELDGRPHDLGATMGVPIDYRRVLGFSRKAGIRPCTFPEERHYSLSLRRAGGAQPLARAAAASFSRRRATSLLHAARGSGALTQRPDRAPSLLHRPWAEVVERHRLGAVSRRLLRLPHRLWLWLRRRSARRVMYANLFRPQTFSGWRSRKPFLWEGGTQPIGKRWRAARCPAPRRR